MSGRYPEWGAAIVAHVRQAVARPAVLVVAVVLVSLLGCEPLSTFQPPDVLAEGERAIGGSALGVGWDGRDPDRSSGILPSLWYRSSIDENTDFGIGIGPFVSTFDIKRVLLRKRLLLSGDLGVSVDTYGDVYDTFALEALLLRPALLLGTEQVYGGVWGLYAVPEDENVTESGVMLGAALGDRRKVMLEYNFRWLHGEERGVAAYGLALQWALGGREQAGK